MKASAGKLTCARKPVLHRLDILKTRRLVDCTPGLTGDLEQAVPQGESRAA